MSADITTFNAPEVGIPAGHYSHAVRVGGMIYISGQLPIDAQGIVLNEAPFAAQVQQVFSNLSHILHAANCTTQNLVQVRVYLSDINLWPQFNQLYADWMGAHKPARCIIPTAELHFGCAIEIEAVAAI